MSKLYIDTRERQRAVDNNFVRWLVNEVDRLNRAELQRVLSHLEIDSLPLYAGNQGSAAQSEPVGDALLRLIDAGDDSASTVKEQKYAALKTTLINVYCDMCGIPALTESFRNKDRFISLHQSRFVNVGSVINEPDIHLTAAYCRHNLSPDIRFIWLDCTAAKRKAAFDNLLKEKIEKVCGVKLPEHFTVSDVAKLTEQWEIVIILNNTAGCTFSGLYKSITEMLAGNPHKFKKIALVNTGETRLQTGYAFQRMADLLAEAGRHLAAAAADKSARLKFVAFALVLVVAVIIYLYSRYTTDSVNVKFAMFYYSGGGVNDVFAGETQILWIDKGGKVLSVETIKNSPEIIISAIQAGAKRIKFVKSACVFSPSEILLDTLKSDSVKILVYGRLSAEISVDGAIGISGAEHWFAFHVPVAGRKTFRCEALDGRFSPQMAIYNGLAAGRKLSRSWNDVGGTLIDTTSAVLDAGDYFLKVRGYDSSTGKFRLSSDFQSN